MTLPDESALLHYEAALAGIARLREQAFMAGTEADWDELREHVTQAFWQARMTPRVTPREVAATPYCRAIPLLERQGKHIEALRKGMLAAERSVSIRYTVAPWAALVHGRTAIASGLPRHAYEYGFVIRLYQLLLEACATSGASP